MPEIATFDHYEVLTRDDGSLFELGRGGMGITYKAFDTSLRIHVALKVINATYLKSGTARERFAREARSAAKLRNRHVASVYHLNTTGDTWFYAMEFIDGETLGALVKRQGPLPPDLALKITAQVARALNAAAQHGLVHRDIKPENLMLVEDDDELVAKVIDFGLAKASIAGDGDGGAMLSVGGFVGTAHFASPEQWEEGEIDSRSDIYSLGITLWYMLAGQVPFLGSMPQVMKQHLETPPPFEKLPGLPTAAMEVLRKMLAKSPADRFQTPAELRRAIEVALPGLGGAPAAQGSTGSSAQSADAISILEIEPEVDLSTLMLDASMGSDAGAGAGSFETNSIIAKRYQVAQSIGETNAGRVFRAYDMQRKCEVRLIVLRSEALGDSMALTAIEAAAEKLRDVRHRNLLGVFGFETVDRGSFLVLEWTEGFSLLELLKARRELTADEAQKILAQAAEGVDYALGLALTGLDFGLHQVQIHFAKPIEKENVLNAPLDTWPEFAVKLYPLGGARDIATWQTWVGEQTVMGGMDFSTDSEDSRLDYIQALAAVAYELLGGTLSPLVLRTGGGALGRYTPLATLSEEGNDVLRRALDRARSYPSARDFTTALTRVAGLPTGSRDTKSASAARSKSSAASTASSESAAPRPKPKRQPLELLYVLAFAVAIGAGLYVFLHSFDEPKQNPAPNHEIAMRDSIGKSGIPVPKPETTPVATTPAPATPAPSPPAPATPPPGPTREELAMSAVDDATKSEEKSDWPKALDLLLSVARKYSEFPVGRNHLETLLNHLRERPSPITPAEFDGMRGRITDAAKMGVLSAKLLLGDNLRNREPKEALSWYMEAAKDGSPTAEMALGFMLTRGGEDDQAKAFRHFQVAAEKKEVGAKYGLGACYRAGSGVRKDLRLAIKFLKEATDGGDTRAMNELGDCYVHGQGVEINFGEAFKLFTTASGRGNLNATGNLGVLYLNGQGVTADPQTAVDLFAKGAQSETVQAPGAQGGRAYCMRLYARCFEAGIGVARSDVQAEIWYRKAAAENDAEAAAWCRLHNILVSAAK